MNFHRILGPISVGYSALGQYKTWVCGTDAETVINVVTQMTSIFPFISACFMYYPRKIAPFSPPSPLDKYQTLHPQGVLEVEKKKNRRAKGKRIVGHHNPELINIH